MKTTVYIDGQNFLYKVAERLESANIISDKQDITSIDIRGLIEPLFQSRDLEIKYYGVKKINHSKDLSEEMLNKANHFSDSLRRLKNYLAKNGVEYVAKGSLKARSMEPCKKCGYSDYKFQEKGVDVGLAIDLVSDAILDKVDRVALLSSDTDLLPALQIVKERKINIAYISFSGQSTVSLAKSADWHVILNDTEIIDSYLRSLN